MDIHAPTPRNQPTPMEANSSAASVPVNTAKGDTSAVTVSLLGAGGCGINISRGFIKDQRLKAALYFDTSMTNTREGEKAFIVANGAGSGSDRSANAANIERIIPQISDAELGVAQVAIICFSLSGGSGSVISPLIIRDLKRRGVRTIAVGIADTSSAVGAKNTQNTLKTLNAIAKNREIYLPMILLSNDNAPSRGMVDRDAKILIDTLIATLTAPVYEVDQNDRLNWLNPTKIISSGPGIKLMSFEMDKTSVDPKIVLGTDSKEMVDSLLILQSSPEDTGHAPLPMARLKKTGFYTEGAPRIVAKVSSDISSIESIIDHVDHMEAAEKAQRHSTIDRLSSDSSDDLIL